MRPVRNNHATLGELGTTISCADLLRYDELQDFYEDLEEEHRRSNRQE